jgi:hypothetical protein
LMECVKFLAVDSGHGFGPRNNKRNARNGQEGT